MSRRSKQPPYRPARDVRLIPEPDAGLPATIQDEIRTAVVKLFANGNPKPSANAYEMPFIAKLSGGNGNFWGMVRFAPNGANQIVYLQERVGNGAWQNVECGSFSCITATGITTVR